MRFDVIVMIVFCSCTATYAEDLPLGDVIEVGSDVIYVKFNQPHNLLLDDMIALYGPGRVEKHPLTQEVRVEHREFVGKAHILELKANYGLKARLTWVKDGQDILPGFDAVPLPGEASPDAPPSLSSPLKPLAAYGQQSVQIQLPIIDPEGGPMAFRWSLNGASGKSGRLSAVTTGLPKVQWTAPTEAPDGELALQVEATDALGQQQQWVLPLQVKAVSGQWRQRELRQFAKMGANADLYLQWTTRGQDGSWWGISQNASIVRLTAGWSWHSLQEVQEGVRLSAPKALVPARGELFVLDATARAILVFAYDGVLRRRIGAFRSPSDLVVTKERELIVADHGLGGVFVYEPSGAMRCRLGRVGEGDDGFKNLDRLAIGPEDVLYALDTVGQRVHVFDRFHRRQGFLEVQTKENVKPVDLAWHPMGLLVLLSDGKVLVFDKGGHATHALTSLSEKNWFDRLSAPTSISVDGAGDIVVTYPREGLLVRYNKKGDMNGVRGQDLWEGQKIVADGNGSKYAVDARTGYISLFDKEGWMVRRFGGTTRYGGPFKTIGAIAVSPEGRFLCVVDTGRICVTRFDLHRPHDKALSFGQRGKNNGQFERPIDIAIDAQGRAYILDSSLRRFSVFNVADGSFVLQYGRYERGRNPEEMRTPMFIAVNSAGSEVFVYNAARYEVMKFAIDHTTKGVGHIANGGGRGRELGQFSRPAGMSCDRHGLIYMLDVSNRNLQIIDFRGNNPVAIHGLKTESVGLRSVEGLAVNPDGMPWLFSRGALVGLRWHGGQ